MYSLALGLDLRISLARRAETSATALNTLYGTLLPILMYILLYVSSIAYDLYATISAQSAVATDVVVPQSSLLAVQLCIS